jgi:eukaryotic-like serine/threonine-protein kinase
MAAIEFRHIEGPGQGQSKRFEDPNIYIAGHSSRCAFQLSAEDKDVSSEHFMLEVNPPGAWIRDLGSEHGTFINDQRIGYGGDRSVTVELNSGDLIRAGQTVYKYLIADDGLSASDVYVVFNTSMSTMLSNPSSPEDFCPPYEIPGFVLLEQSIHGRMGSVFKAYHTADKKTVTLKTITPVVPISTYRMNQIKREIDRIGQFDHENVVSFVAGGEFSNGFYIATELCEGGDIKQLVKERKQPFQESEALPLMLDALRGLEYVHSMKIAHGDLKPSNLLLTKGRKSVKIGDLRLVKCYVRAGLSRLTMNEEAGGTLHFMPVDQFLNYKYSKPAGDIWSMGATLYRLLTGKYPYDFRDGSDDVRVMMSEPIKAINSRGIGIAAELAAIVDKSVARDPGERYQSMTEFRQDLEKYMA